MTPPSRPPSPLRVRPLSEWRKRTGVPYDQFLSVGLRYTVLTFYVATVYVVVLALGVNRSQREPPPWWLTVTALAVIIPTFVPLHNRVRQAVNQLVYAQHENPYALLTELHHHLEATPTPQALLPTVAATLAAILKLPYVAIQTELLPDNALVAYGVVPEHAEILSLPVTYRTATLGTLSVSAREPYGYLSPDDTRVLRDLIRQVGITLYATQLSEALQASREALVVAREEERRRIRRDLHDSLGPTLASLQLQLGVVRQLVPTMPGKAERLIEEVRTDIAGATAEIRRLVYDLRPPMLDDLGLVEALANLDLTTAGLRRQMEVPTTLPPLPAAVEVAVYRIAAEALHNVVRHAHASECSVRLVIEASTLILTVRDNGCGLEATYLAGVGHRSMHERAAELGGWVTILNEPTGGTCVRACFPVKVTHHDPSPDSTHRG